MPMQFVPTQETFFGKRLSPQATFRREWKGEEEIENLLMFERAP